ncbi:MAG: hypothetical protein QXJ45_07515 [Thermoproteota archaeon]
MYEIKSVDKLESKDVTEVGKEVQEIVKRIISNCSVLVIKAHNAIETCHDCPMKKIVRNIAEELDRLSEISEEMKL